MYYELYEQKMLKIARIRDKIYKLRFLILAGILLIVAIVVGLLSFKGAILYGVEIQNSYVYGDPISPKATAFLSKVEYEYFNGKTWSGEQPVLPGEYRIRATAKKCFGGYAQSEEKSFSITQKTLSLSYSNTVTYGDSPMLVATGLVEGDRITEDIKFTFSGILTDDTRVVLEQNSFSIIREDGSVVTEGYTIDESIFRQTEVILLPRPITLRLAGGEKVYDGKPLTSDGWSIERGELVSGDFLSVECIGEQLLVGESKNVATVEVTDANGTDISALYAIDVKANTLKVTKRPIEITTGSAEKTYDGEILTNRQFSITGKNQTVENEFIELLSATERIYAGEQENVLAMAVLTNDGEDRSDCYEITYFNGTLKINPRNVTVRCESYQKTYDGVEFNEIAWSISSGEIVDGERLEAETAAMQNNVFVEAKDAGSYILTMKKLKVFDDVVDTTQNYIFHHENGTLDIFKRDLVIHVSGAKKIYDALPYSIENDAAFYSVDGAYPLASGEFCYANVTSKNYVDVGVYENAITAEMHVYNTEGKDTTYNYNVETRNGKDGGVLTILKRPIELCLQEKERPYDGTALKSNDFFVYEDGTTALLPVSWHDVELTASGSITEPGTVANRVTGIKITENGVDVTGNYQITSRDSVLRVVKRAVQVMPFHYHKVYDGKAISYNEDFPIYIVWGRSEDRQYGSPLLAGDTMSGGIEYDILMNAGTYEGARVVEDSFRILDKQGRNVTNKYYEVTFIAGTVEIALREIYVTSLDVEQIYSEGTVLMGTAKDCRITKGTLINGDTIEYVVTAQLNEVGSTVNQITSVTIRNKNGKIQGKVLFDANGNMIEGNKGVNGGYNYQIYVTCGTLTLYPESIE